MVDSRHRLQLWHPRGVAVDASGNLIIADDSNRIRKVSNGMIVTMAGGGPSFGDNGPATSAQLSLPNAVAVDSAGNLFIADLGNNRIRKVTPQGTITTVAGNGTQGFSGDGGPATLAKLSVSYGVAVDASGNLFIGDSSRVRKVTPQGIITTVAGSGTPGFSGDGGPATSAQLVGVGGVAVDASGNLFIADIDNCRIRKVTPQGTISSVAGNGKPGFSGDRGPATSAQLFFPQGVVLDASGNLFIADQGNNRIRQLVPSFSSVGCVYSIDQSAQSFGAAGGTNSVGVLASGTSCSWMAVILADWITVSQGGLASGTGLVTYTVSPNPASASRAGTIWIAGQSLTVS